MEEVCIGAILDLSLDYDTPTIMPSVHDRRYFLLIGECQLGLDFHIRYPSGGYTCIMLCLATDCIVSLMHSKWGS